MNSKPTLLGKYKVVFLLPLVSNKTLGEDGWEFSGTKRLNPIALDFLTSTLGLVFAENYLDMDRYVDENIQATVVYDIEGKIEHIDFQLYNEGKYQQLCMAFASSDLKKDCELFVPEEITSH